MARLEGGGDDDVASLGLLRPQEDATRVDVDGAGGLMLQAVHTVLPVLFHLCGDRRRWATRGHTQLHATTHESVPPPAGHHERISRIHGLGMSRTRDSMKTKLGQCLARAEKGEEAQRSLCSQINTRETSNVTQAGLSLQREECITCPLPRRLGVETVTAW